MTVLKSAQLKNVDKKQKEALVFSIEELVLFSSSHDKASQSFDVQFSDNNGNINFFAISFRTRPDGDLDVYRSSLTGKFKLAKDYMYFGIYIPAN